ncbi:MAG: D-glycerate dehydrogenase [Actinomycetota bacterium]
MPPAPPPRVVVTRRLPGEGLGRLAAAADLWVWPQHGPVPRPILIEQAATAAGLLCTGVDPVDAALLDAAPALRVISSYSVGLDNVDLAECTRRGIPVGHTPDVLTESTADIAFGLLLAAARRFKEGIDLVRRDEWIYWHPDMLLGEEVHSSTIGIVGLGRIGTAVARRAAGFGMRILYYSTRRRPEVEARLGAVFRATLPALLTESDHVVLTVPLTPETHHLIGASALAAMKPTATLVNASRGPVVDPDALVEALRSGKLAAAALDVTEPEPLPADHPLVGLPNCTILPHLGSASRVTRSAMTDLAVANLLAGLRGEPMPACANPGAAAGRSPR